MSFSKVRHMAELGNAALLQNLAAVRKRIADSVQQRTKVSCMQINTKVHGHTSVEKRLNYACLNSWISIVVCVHWGLILWLYYDNESVLVFIGSNSGPQAGLCHQNKTTSRHHCSLWYRRASLWWELCEYLSYIKS